MCGLLIGLKKIFFKKLPVTAHLSITEYTRPVSNVYLHSYITYSRSALKRL